MADLLRASIPERGAASTLQELLLRSQPLPRSPLRQYSSSSCSEAAAMAAADSLLTPLESCKNGVHSSWHQVVRQRQVSSGQHGHHRLWCGQPPSGAASAASRRPLPRGKRYVFGGSRQRRNQQGDKLERESSTRSSQQRRPRRPRPPPSPYHASARASGACVLKVL